MTIASVYILLALVFYTTSIWAERIKKKLAIWMILLFGLAFALDYFGTHIMITKAAGNADYSVHGLSGYLALGIMGLHLLWAILSKFWKRCAHLFHKCSIYAWGLWLLAFMSGMIMSMSHWGGS